MSEREPSGFACQSCGKDFSEHLGLVGTCKELAAAQQRVAELESVYQWVCDEEFAAHVKAAKSKGTTKAMHNQYREAMRRVSERMRKALNQ